jgi:hypothetical protein
MKRVITKAPSTIELSSLSKEQQDAIASVYTQFVLPMPGTIVFGGSLIIDAITSDNFDPSVINPLSLPFEVIGLWQWDGISQDLLEITPLNPEFTNFLADPSTLGLPHSFSGWPDVI